MPCEDGELVLWDEYDRLCAEVSRLVRENDFLRARVVTSDKECIYCGLGSADMAKCAQGFPGCVRADDMQLCPHAYEKMEVERLTAEPRSLTPEQLEKLEPVLSEVRKALAAISGAFVWSDHPDGIVYWRGVADRLGAIIDATKVDKP
ncbi:MAG: hypothetical protein ACP5P4_05290 [Steroidobacteraceae bacterium]